MDSVLFSVIVPVYNVEKYIDECIVSIINQSYSKWELILVDDGSPDNSGAICDAYERNDARIKVIHKDNQGLMSARRIGIEHAVGDYYCFLDSDDYYDTNALKILLTKITKYDTDCVIFGYDKFDENGVFFSTEDVEEFVSNKRMIYRKCFGNDVYNPVCRKCVKASVFDGRDYTDFYKYSKGEDLFQSIEILENSKNVLIIPDRIYKYRVNPSSITHNFSKKTITIDFTIMEKVLEFLSNVDCFLESDLQEYCDHAYDLVAEILHQITYLDVDRKNKKKYFKEIFCSTYFQRVNTIKKASDVNNYRTRIYIKHLQKENYNMLLLMLKAESILKLIVNYCKKFFPK